MRRDFHDFRRSKRTNLKGASVGLAAQTVAHRKLICVSYFNLSPHYPRAGEAHHSCGTVVLGDRHRWREHTLSTERNTRVESITCEGSVTRALSSPCCGREGGVEGLLNSLGKAFKVSPS